MHTSAPMSAARALRNSFVARAGNSGRPSRVVRARPQALSRKGPMAFWNKLEKPEQGGPAADPLPYAPPQSQLQSQPQYTPPQPPIREKEERTSMAMMKREDV